MERQYNRHNDGNDTRSNVDTTLGVGNDSVKREQISPSSEDRHQSPINPATLMRRLLSHETYPMPNVGAETPSHVPVAQTGRDLPQQYWPVATSGDLNSSYYHSQAAANIRQQHGIWGPPYSNALGGLGSEGSEYQAWYPSTSAPQDQRSRLSMPVRTSDSQFIRNEMPSSHTPFKPSSFPQESSLSLQPEGHRLHYLAPTTSFDQSRELDSLHYITERTSIATASSRTGLESISGSSEDYYDSMDSKSFDPQRKIEDRLLLHLKNTSNHSWKEIVSIFQERFGRKYTVPMLQMRYYRLRKQADAERAPST